MGALSAGLVNAVARGIAIRIVADRATLRNGALSFMVRTELVESGQIVDWQDFRGRTVANNGTGTGAQLALQRGLRSGGLTFQDVDQQIIPFPDMIPALGNGSIDLGARNRAADHGGDHARRGRALAARHRRVFRTWRFRW